MKCEQKVSRTAFIVKYFVTYFCNIKKKITATFDIFNASFLNKKKILLIPNFWTVLCIFLY